MARHFRSSTTPDSDSVFYLFTILLSENPMYDPPLTSSSRCPVSFSFPSVVATSRPVVTHPAHEKRPVHVRSIQLARSNLHLHSVSSSRVAQFRFPLPFVPTVPRICSVHISDDRWDTRTPLRTTHTPRILQSILRPSGLSKTPLRSESNSSVSIYPFGYGPSYAGQPRPRPVRSQTPFHSTRPFVPFLQMPCSLFLFSPVGADHWHPLDFICGVVAIHRRGARWNDWEITIYVTAKRKPRSERIVLVSTSQLSTHCNGVNIKLKHRVADMVTGIQISSAILTVTPIHFHSVSTYSSNPKWTSGDFDTYSVPSTHIQAQRRL